MGVEGHAPLKKGWHWGPEYLLETRRSPCCDGAPAHPTPQTWGVMEENCLPGERRVCLQWTHPRSSATPGMVFQDSPGKKEYEV